MRIFETGFAVKFIEKQKLNDLSRLIIRTEKIVSATIQFAAVLL